MLPRKIRTVKPDVLPFFIWLRGQDLKEIVMDKRREEMLHKWILDKQKHTYVRINENWQKCDFKYPGWIKKD